MALGEGRVYGPDGDDLRDLHLRQRRADEPARREADRGASTAGRRAWSTCAGWCRSTRPSSARRRRTRKRILIVDEGRHSAGVGEGIITAIVEGGYGARPFQRVVGADTFTPLAGAAFLVIPSDEDIVAAADRARREGLIRASATRPASNARSRNAMPLLDHRHSGRSTGNTASATQPSPLRAVLTIWPNGTRADVDVRARPRVRSAFEQRQPAFDLAEEVRARDDFLPGIAPLLHAEGVQAVEREHLRRPLFGLRRPAGAGSPGADRPRASAIPMHRHALRRPSARCAACA